MTSSNGHDSGKNVFYERIEDAIERNRLKMPEVRERLEKAGVKYLLSCWIDLHGILE